MDNAFSGRIGKSKIFHSCHERPTVINIFRSTFNRKTIKSASKDENDKENISLKVPLGGQGKLYGIVAVPETCPRGILTHEISGRSFVFPLNCYILNFHSSIGVSSGFWGLQCGANMSAKRNEWQNLSLIINHR